MTNPDKAEGPYVVRENSPDRGDALIWALTELMLSDGFDLNTYLEAYS